MKSIYRKEEPRLKEKLDELDEKLLNLVGDIYKGKIDPDEFYTLSQSTEEGNKGSSLLNKDSQMLKIKEGEVADNELDPEIEALLEDNQTLIEKSQKTSIKETDIPIKTEKILSSTDHSISKGHEENTISARVRDQLSKGDLEDFTKIFQFDYHNLSSAEERMLEVLKDRFLRSKYSIENLESGPYYEKTPLFNNMLESVDNLRRFYKTLDLSKLGSEHIIRLAGFVERILEYIGANQSNTFLLLHLSDYITPSIPYLSAHSINTTVLSLLLSIELSKLMREKLVEKEISTNVRLSYLATEKVFDVEDMIKLGLAGLLHDISLKMIFPDLKRDDILERDLASIYKNHAQESVRHLRRAERLYDPEINVCILHHHERIDGSGFPRQIKEEMFTKFSKVLSFTDYYELNTFKGPIYPQIGAGRVLRKILHKERKAFDSDVLFAFTRLSSFYPLGSYVFLNTGEIALVNNFDKKDLKRPGVMVVMDEQNNKIKDFQPIQLADYDNIVIEKIIHPQIIKETFTKEEIIDHFGVKPNELIFPWLGKR